VGLTLVTAASGPPLTAADLRAHCSIDSEDTSFDGLLTDYIAAATAMAQDFTGSAIGAQTWKLALDAFPAEIELPRGPVTGVSWVKYFDQGGTERTLDSGQYLQDLISNPQRLVLAPNCLWPTTQVRVNAVTVQFVTGYADSPAQILQAIRMTVASWFAGREAGEIPTAALGLLRALRVIRI
jgi:uncharacterized phiE125 gp8 family phage protein